MNALGWATILAAVIAAAASIYVARLARSTKNEASERRLQRRQIEDLQADMLTMKRFAFGLRSMLAGANVQPPEMPRLRSEEWD